MRIFSLFSILLFVSCSQKDESSLIASNSCPGTISASSNLPVSPAPSADVPLHVNGINSTWNWQLKGTINTSYNVDVYDIDLFDASAATISALKASGKKVVCYFSAGSGENWRSDYSSFQRSDLGTGLEGWVGESWLDIRSQNVLTVMTNRLNLAVTKGCDGVEPDNMNIYTQSTCFNITANDQLAYNRAIANLARSRGLSVALKNDPGQVPALVNYFDFAVTEQCYYYNECPSYSPFISAAKPVFNAEYDLAYRSNPARTNLCSYSSANNIRTIVFALELDDTYRSQCF